MMALKHKKILAIDDADAIANKIRKAKTDPEALPSEVKGLEGRPEAANLVSIYAALSGQTAEQVLKEFGGKQFSAFKPALSDLAVVKLTPMTKKMSELMKYPDQIDVILKVGNERAAGVAEKTLKEARELMGFWG